MNSSSFVYWLQGFFEFHEGQLTDLQTARIKEELGKVFTDPPTPNFSLTNIPNSTPYINPYVINSTYANSFTGDTPASNPLTDDSLPAA